ncbi:hypothetical protein SLEP1_g4553 [Rubroshorea leprosula]|uniref:Uncharacterized protein n=1 Tax=Rubroshorea leprosula TaxID=152421 RepID=A0AAV5HWS8_9ROSI|nr:hypothetical protein SLEP1_g4553 [Rubroshorea leprosula]
MKCWNREITKNFSRKWPTFKSVRKICQIIGSNRKIIASNMGLAECYNFDKMIYQKVSEVVKRTG